MPGTPDPVLGSDALTSAVAFVVAAVLVVLPVLLRDRLPPPRRWALGGGLAYAFICIGTWAGTRLVADAFVSSLIERPASVAVLLVVGAIVLGAQAAIPYYLHARWRLFVPLVGLLGATHLVLFTFLQVGGETDSLGLYTLLFGPFVVGILVVAALAEVGGRWAVSAVRQ